MIVMIFLPMIHLYLNRTCNKLNSHQEVLGEVVWCIRLRWLEWKRQSTTCLTIRCNDHTMLAFSVLQMNKPLRLLDLIGPTTFQRLNPTISLLVQCRQTTNPPQGSITTYLYSTRRGALPRRNQTIFSSLMTTCSLWSSGQTIFLVLCMMLNIMMAASHGWTNNQPTILVHLIRTKKIFE